MKKILYFTLILTTIGCESNKNLNSSGNSIEDQEMRSLVLEDIVDSLIIPSYANLSLKLGDLQSSFAQFKQSRDINDFNVLKNRWKSSYIAWQYVEMYNIGKADDIYYYNKMNTYPVNTTIINNNIQNQMYDFSANNFSNFTSQGFPTIDYLLYGLDVDSSLILGFYQNNDNYIFYLEHIIDELIINTNIVQNSWNTERNSFINSNRNTVTSSLNLFINDFIFYYEKGFRANKIGIPSGVYSNTILPLNVEGYYVQNLSKILSLHALEAITNVFKGQSFIGSKNINSISSYINFVDGQLLSNQISNKLDNAYLAINVLDDNFVYQIQNNPFSMLSTFDVVQEAVPLLKVEMLNSLNINVDYVDADGD